MSVKELEKIIHLESIIALYLLFFTVSCTKDSYSSFEENSVVAATGVSIVTGIRNISVNTTLQLNAEVTPDNAANKTILWSSDDPTIATVDQDGLIEAVSAGTVQITAALEENTTLFDVVALTVNDGAFVTTWDNTTEIIIPTNPTLSYNYDVDWDNDGVFEDLGVTGNASKSDFATTGPHTVRIRGQFPAIRFVSALSGDSSGNIADKIVAVNQWGNIEWESMNTAFISCSNLEFPATDIPNLSRVTNMSGMFSGANIADPDVSLWDVSNVEDMSGMFSGANAADPDVRHWDVANVEDMSGMFLRANVADPDMSNWVIPNVTDMRRMFSEPLFFGGFSASSLSPENYSAALVNFASQPTQNDVALGAFVINFCDEQSVVDAKATLEARGWVIDDAGSTNCNTP